MMRIKLKTNGLLELKFIKLLTGYNNLGYNAD